MKKSVKITFVTTPVVQDALKKISEKEERTISWLVDRYLRDRLTADGHLPESGFGTEKR